MRDRDPRVALYATMRDDELARLVDVLLLDETAMDSCQRLHQRTDRAGPERARRPLFTLIHGEVVGVWGFLCGAKRYHVADVDAGFCGWCHFLLEAVRDPRRPLVETSSATHDCGEWRTAGVVAPLCGVRPPIRSVLSPVE